VTGANGRVTRDRHDMPYITVGQENSSPITIHYEDVGSGQPVVLIHGFPLSGRSWEKQIPPLLEAGFRVITYDRRGFGQSSQPSAGYDYDTFAADLDKLLTALDLRDAVIAGFSMGGGEVARYMSRHGGKGIVQAGLIASVVPYLLKDDSNPDGVPPDFIEEQMKQPIREDRAAFFEKFPRLFYGVGYITSPVSEGVLHHFRLMALQAGLKGTLDCIDAFAKTDFRPDLAAFGVPTLIVHGTSDQTVPIDLSARVAARGIAQAQLIEYEGEPHGLNVTAKDRLSRDMLAFLAGRQV
jgi:non-heme chloroperoxidase